MRSLCRLIDWYGSLSSASFGPSAGRLALGLLRHYSPPKLLCTHTDDDCHRIERDAATGGRASSWFFGHVGGDPERSRVRYDGPEGYTAAWVPGPIAQIDISSMYPSLLRDRTYPVKLHSYTEQASVRQVIDAANGIGVVATVTARTRVPEYPVRRRGFVVYPLGQFTATLTGPELLRLAADGEILRVHAMATYYLGSPFVGAAQVLLDAREQAKRNGDTHAESYCKLVANSMAGKLAQRKRRWARVSKRDIPGQWGDEYVRTGGGLPDRHYRYLAGQCYEEVRDGVQRGPYTFAFAYLCAYGRLAMRDIRELCPARSVVSQDTDGLWALPAGLAAIRAAGLLGESGPGRLRVVKQCQSGRWLGPRHYEVDGEWTLSGFLNPILSGDQTYVMDYHRAPLISQGMRQGPDRVDLTFRRSKLLVQPHHGVIGADGWWRPSASITALDDEQRPKA